MGAKDDGQSNEQSTSEAPAAKASGKGRHPRGRKKAARKEEEGQAQDEAQDEAQDSPEIETTEEGHQAQDDQAHDQAQDDEEARQAKALAAHRTPKQIGMDLRSKIAPVTEWRSPKQARRFRTHNRGSTAGSVATSTRGKGGIGGRGRR